MLLLIVLANTVYYLYSRDHSGSSGHPLDGSAVDKVVQAVLIIGVDLRVYPMFAFLFGYGLVMLLRSQQRRGRSDQDARRLVQRRNLWLILFGAVHAILLWGGDILGAYGLTGLILVWLFLRRSDRTLLIWAGVGATLVFLLAALSTLEGVAILAGEETPSEVGGWITAIMTESVATESVVAAALLRITMWPIQIFIVQGILGLVVPVSILLGIWAARRQILERPSEHRRLLWIVAVGGVAIGWAGAMPHALTHVGIFSGLEPVLSSFAAPQMLTGLACGLGYVAAFGLIGDRLAGRPLGRWAGAVSAVGKRSMTCYLAQSVLCAPLLAAWGLGLGAHLGSATMATYAVGVWLITVVYAVYLERAGKAGPAETLMRRLTGRDGRAP
ncbi:DUF418 domain-containing protein [Natronosporangium hydrolyticum]|uniref:DUF418 domain-containing protein n=1 Tax=Natronosporangium hydrolyticum TaxID=2811111 RepID=A0A895YI86_9ACTN|nr:DUF418 domain-containing protein [Natronosporangium hydrolyticum]QSB13850.1 DUF418 domain-containing protein [Natronosporangium hydrolyticum]